MQQYHRFLDRRHRFGALIIAFTLIVALALQTAAPRSAQAQAQLDDIAAQIATDGTARVIVNLNVARQPEAQLTPDQVRSQRSRIAAAQDLVTRRVYGTQAAEVRRLETVAAAAYQIDAAALAQLQNDPLVASIQLDRLRAPLMYNSNTVIGANQVWNYGITGAGQTVAVLDSGVDKNHEFLSGQVVSEACYSSTYAYYGSTSLCPGGVAASTAAGAGLDCNTAIAGCGHGTHVAGTIAGTPLTVTTVDGDYAISGVAPDATLIAIQVFSQFPQSQCGAGASGPCILSFDSDQIAGLERVYALRNTYDIAAVNMSLGGGQYSAACNSEAPAYTQIVADLKAAGIAVVVASGNDGFTGYVSFPACISDVVTVASTASVPDYYGAPAVDSVSYFSNVSAQVDLYAPGQLILSSTGGSYAQFQGTSMATPHVAGAFALLGEMAPASSVTQTLQALTSTGKSITARGYTRPRIRLEQAIMLVAPPTSAAVSGSAGALEISWANQMPITHSVLLQKLSINAGSFTPVVTLTNQIGGGTPTYTDTAAVPACTYRMAAKSGTLQTAYTEVDNTTAPVGLLSFTAARMGSTLTLYACGLPADTNVTVSVNGTEVDGTEVESATSDSHGRLRLELQTNAAAGFGRYTVVVTVDDTDLITLGYDLASALTLRSAGSALFYPTAKVVAVPASIAPVVVTTLMPYVTR